MSFGVFDQNCSIRVSVLQSLLLYLVENLFLYKMDYSLYFQKAGKVVKNPNY